MNQSDRPSSPVLRPVLRPVSRRTFFKAAALSACAVYGLTGVSSVSAKDAAECAALPLFIPPDYQPLGRTNPALFARRLSRALQAHVRESYAANPLPVWNAPLSAIDLSPRLDAAGRLIVEAVRRQSGYPVDPVWIASMIMVESFYNEFAVSRSLAVGMCQFMPATGASLGLRVIDPQGVSTLPGVTDAKKASALTRHDDLRKEVAQARRKVAEYGGMEELLRQALQAQASGKALPEAKALLRDMEVLERKSESLRSARNEAQAFMRMNLEGRSIFSGEDLDFLRQFDERTVPQACIPAMVELMSQNLAARSGSLLAATSAYNAGLSTTKDSGAYEPYGRIPNISETASYVSRIAVHHHGILRHMGAEG